MDLVKLNQRKLLLILRIAKKCFKNNGFYYDNQEVKLADIKFNEFYIAFLIDKNFNGIIDEGELTKITIKIK